MTPIIPMEDTDWIGGCRQNPFDFDTVAGNPQQRQTAGIAASRSSSEIAIAPFSLDMAIPE
jgi:hypothetical protein